MSLQGGPAAVLSTIVVAGLAVGLGFGAHAVIGEADVGASPSASSSSPSPSSAALSDDVCVLMDDMLVVMGGLDDTALGADFSIDGDSTDETAALNALHASGQDVKDTLGTVADYLSHGAELATDPEAADAFVAMANYMREMGQRYGQAAIEAESLDGYMTAVLALSADPEFAALANEGDAASPIVEQYVLETCGRDILGPGAESGIDAKSDVSLLGKEMATYFVDWDGVTQPEVTVTDGEYYLDGVLIGTQTPGVALTDQYANGSTDWCVEVSSEVAPTEVYTYSAQEGILQGTCASLVP